MSSPNDSLDSPLLSNSFLYPHFYRCSEVPISSSVFTTFTATSFLLLIPLSACVFVDRIQQWWKRRCASSATSMSHSDFLTYNIIAMEPIGLFASGFYCRGMYWEDKRMMKVGVYIIFIVYLGRMLFQCLTCVEHYLAVIHPVTYLRLKSEQGIRVRNATIGSVWLVCLGVLSFVALFDPSLPTIPFFVFFAVGLLVISFFKVSVLLALTRPGPGEAGGERKRVDQSKRRAFLNIAAITGVMFLKYLGLLVCKALHASSLLENRDGCVVLMFAFWFCLPSSLSLPLLYLYRAGKLPRFGEMAKTGRRM